MAILLCCRLCAVEMARIELADGSVSLLCIDCDLVGLEHEIAGGARVWTAGLGRGSRDAKASARARR